MARTLPPLRLSRSPVVLVLCQVRIAAVRNMANYIPRLQDRLRKERFPVDVGGEVVEMAFQAEGSTEERRRAHWEFRTMEEDWSIIVRDNAVVVQTTAYSDFDEFLRVLSVAMTAVDSVVGDLVVERVGLRFVNFVEPRPDESWKDYVESCYHGQESAIFRPGTPLHFVQMVAKTGSGQDMIARLTQNRDGTLLPPDLLRHPPVLRRQAEQARLVTLLDLDHYREVRQQFEIGKVVEVAWKLHEGIGVMFRDMVTERALEAWR